MLAWLSENIGNIILCLVLLLIVGAIVLKLVRDKKKGTSPCGCGGSCESCGCCTQKESK